MDDNGGIGCAHLQIRKFGEMLRERNLVDDIGFVLKNKCPVSFFELYSVLNDYSKLEIRNMIKKLEEQELFIINDKLEIDLHERFKLMIEEDKKK